MKVKYFAYIISLLIISTAFSVLADEEANKQLVVETYTRLVNERDLSAFDNFGEVYIQHNPNGQNGTESIVAVLDTLPRGTTLRIKHVIAEGDLVFVHSQLAPPGADEDDEFVGLALADIFRVDKGKIVEHWDVTQDVPAKSASGNSMFSDLYGR